MVLLGLSRKHPLHKIDFAEALEILAKDTISTLPSASQVMTSYQSSLAPNSTDAASIFPWVSSKVVPYSFFKSHSNCLNSLQLKAFKRKFKATFTAST